MVAGPARRGVEWRASRCVSRSILWIYIYRGEHFECQHWLWRLARPAVFERLPFSPWAQERDGYVLTIFHKLNPSNSCPVSALTHGPFCGPGCRFLRCYG